MTPTAASGMVHVGPASTPVGVAAGLSGSAVSHHHESQGHVETHQGSPGTDPGSTVGIGSLRGISQQITIMTACSPTWLSIIKHYIAVKNMMKQH